MHGSVDRVTDHVWVDRLRGVFAHRSAADYRGVDIHAHDLQRILPANNPNNLTAAVGSISH
jgi:hypothetical protein